MKMRAWTWIITLATVLAVAVIIGCSDDDEQEQPDPQQATQQQETQESTDSSTTGAAQSASDDASDGSAQQPADQDAQQAQDSDEPSSSDAGSLAKTDLLFSAAARALETWSTEVETMELVVNVDLDLGLLASQIETIVTAQLAPFVVLTTTDVTSLFLANPEPDGDSSDDGRDAPDEPIVMHMLISEDAAYISLPGSEGWVDVSSDVDGALGELSAVIGDDPTEMANPEQFDAAFGCVDAVGGSIVESEYEGQPVWIIECNIDVDTINEATAQALTDQGFLQDDAPIETMWIRTTISQTNGAPLVSETEMTMSGLLGMTEDDASDSSDQASGGQLFVSSVARLVRWNQPVEFPTPEPLLDGSLFGFDTDATNGASPGSDSDGAERVEPGELLEPDALLQMAEDWLSNVSDLEILFITDATINGEARQVSNRVLVSRSEGAFEVATTVDDSDPFRVLWNRDGIWVSEQTVGGAAVWQPSNPVLLGLGGMTVDEFLNSPDRYSLSGYEDLLEIAWVSRTIEGSGPPIYELGFEFGFLTPDHPYFAPVAHLLKSDITELFSDNVTIEEIEYFSATVTIDGDTGAVLNEVGSAEFQTTAGAVELTTTDNLHEGAPLGFSQPNP